MKSYALSLLVLLIVSVELFAQSPADKLHLQADECLKLAGQTVLDFYLPGCIDTKVGGFHENLGDDGQFTAGNKFLTLQARHLWTFSAFAERGIRTDECLAAATQGYKFIREKFYDAKHGGYFNELNADGSVKDDNKHAYLNSFVIYAFVAYYRATGDESALAAAIDVFDVLEDKAYDRSQGGYQEFFLRDWSPVTDPKTPGIVGAVGVKTYNTHLHLMESFADLYRACGEERVGRRLAELISINTVTVQHKKFPCNIDAWSPDWHAIESPTNMRASYGHDVECAWLVLDAARALEWNEAPLRQWAVRMVDYSLEHGFDGEHGGFYYSGPVGEPASDQHKEWWVQAEAMVCMLDMYRLTGDKKYLTTFDATYDFVKRFQIAESGGWWASRAKDGSPSSNLSRASKWQCGYHTGRALLRSADLLHQIADAM